MLLKKLLCIETGRCTSPVNRSELLRMASPNPQTLNTVYRIRESREMQAENIRLYSKLRKSRS
jgi:hypothetical protein